MRRKFVPVLIYPAVIVSTIALAGQENVPPAQSPAEANDIRQLLEMTGAGKTFIPLLPAMFAPLKKALPKVPEEFWDELLRGVTAEGVVDRIVPFYEKYYTEDDVKQLISFYQSPVGRKVIQVQPELQRDLLADGQRWGAELAGQAMMRLAEKGYIQKAHSRLVSAPQPVYPPLAKNARIQGVVKLQAVIDTDGSIAYLRLISGHPLLVNAAMDAVQHWRYEPTLVDGKAVTVLTEIDVNFTLQDNKAEVRTSEQPARASSGRPAVNAGWGKA